MIILSQTSSGGRRKF